MRIPFYFFMLFIVITIRGQVGINTKLPEATLDVVGKPSDSNHYDGIIPPRITGDQLSKKKYSTSKNGAVVFVTTPSTNLLGQVVNVAESGLYYFDGHMWQALLKKQRAVEYRIILTFDDTNDDMLTAESKWNEPIDLWEDKYTYLTSTKYYKIGTKKIGGLKGSIVFKKIDGIINIKLEISKKTDFNNVDQDVKIDISGICNEIGYFPTDIAFLHTEENPTFIIPIYFQNKSIYIPSVNFSYISSNLIGSFQGYSSWIRPHLR
ncbi:hypothetical protein HIO71_13975 [Chryseobacterium aquaticum]|uniref:Uncharacterized protein n=1 Tax=Chryseobacterium aquaticum TaxID=452084 RepID=A0A848NA16_9FLAO|nr:MULTISPECIES: hypothetical protein [Chryseobacterium]NMR35291.1 hypothetical protein [Chryseobacterium aquaticum]NRQ47271.1 hypothetical protein [Chryseobacterium sp. C-204]